LACAATENEKGSQSCLDRKEAPKITTGRAVLAMELLFGAHKEFIVEPFNTATQRINTLLVSSIERV
jgi:hypothetical protein